MEDLIRISEYEINLKKKKELDYLDFYYMWKKRLDVDPSSRAGQVHGVIRIIRCSRWSAERHENSAHVKASSEGCRICRSGRNPCLKWFPVARCIRHCHTCLAQALKAGLLLLPLSWLNDRRASICPGPRQTVQQTQSFRDRWDASSFFRKGTYSTWQLSTTRS